MSAFDASAARTSKLAIPIDTIKSIAAPLIWQYLDDHQNDAAFHISGKAFGVVPYSITLRAGDPRLRAFVAWLIGPDPRGTLPGVPA